MHLQFVDQSPLFLALGLQSVELASLLLTLHSPVLPCLSPQTGPPGILDFFGGQIFCWQKMFGQLLFTNQKKVISFSRWILKIPIQPLLDIKSSSKKLSRFGLKPQPFHLPSGRHPVFEYGEHDEPPTTCKNGPETPNHDLCEHARCRTVSLSSKDSGSIAAMVTSNDDLNSSAKPFWRFGRQNLPSLHPFLSLPSPPDDWVHPIAGSPGWCSSAKISSAPTSSCTASNSLQRLWWYWRWILIIII